MRRINPDRPLTESERNKRYYENHRDEELSRNRRYHQENKKKVNNRHRLYAHGMSQEEHNARMKKQKNRCAVCRKRFLKTPHIDHSHETGRNRGLLCKDCNLGLGRFKDSVKILRAAIKYLRSTLRSVLERTRDEIS
jgi:hypothetical protein